MLRGIRANVRNISFVHGFADVMRCGYSCYCGYCILVCARTHAHKHTHTHTHTYTHTHIHTRTHTHTHAHTHTHMHTRTHTNTHTRTHIHTNKSTSTHKHICTRIHYTQALQTSQASTPSVAMLLPSSASNETNGLAQRLGMIPPCLFKPILIEKHDQGA